MDERTVIEELAVALADLLPPPLPPPASFLEGVQQYEPMEVTRARSVLARARRSLEQTKNG